jgi:hypothetical protein
MKNFLGGFSTGEGGGWGRSYVGHMRDHCVLKRLAVLDKINNSEELYLSKERLLHYYLVESLLSLRLKLVKTDAHETSFSAVIFAPVSNLASHTAGP